MEVNARSYARKPQLSYHTRPLMKQFGEPIAFQLARIIFYYLYYFDFWKSALKVPIKLLTQCFYGNSIQLLETPPVCLFHRQKMETNRI